MQTHNFMATYQQGIVIQVDGNTHQVRCIIPALENLETAWLPFLTLNAGGNRFYCLPDEGELVALLLDARGEGGCVLGAIYNAEDLPPASTNNLWLKQFSNGTKISHDRQTGNVSISTSGEVFVSASKVYISADCEITGDVVINGDLTTSGIVAGGSIKQGNIELSSHTHTEQGDGKPTSSAQA